MSFTPDKWAIRSEAERLFVAHNRANGALYPYGFGFLKPDAQAPWLEKATESLSKAEGHIGQELAPGEAAQ